MQLNGVVLLSSIMNYGVRNEGFDQNYINYLPSYAATAWYHNKLANRPATVEQAVQQARDFARGPYAAALALGHDLPPAQKGAIAQQMSALTGMSAQFLIASDLRVDLQRFRKEILRDQRRTVGRFDSRFTASTSTRRATAPSTTPAPPASPAPTSPPSTTG